MSCHDIVFTIAMSIVGVGIAQIFGPLLFDRRRDERRRRREDEVWARIFRERQERAEQINRERGL